MSRSGLYIFSPFEGSSGSYFERPQHVDILQVGTREHTLILSFAQFSNWLGKITYFYGSTVLWVHKLRTTADLECENTHH